ncbi:hypothetical protein T4A_4377 [Trichinella pseudospiralis]|uniref:Uncharacterized protein n=1 Tax=Trichinella pseudospiralis TaxID=6337 RepID=A0A0V1EBW7_TRIPS|nr:hypothetical protein T4A_4377 [Trichinella pseudospiralis]KRZ30672.1 hypothetical protein T4C_3265 [Trichinella pseudospiralis]
MPLENNANRLLWTSLLAFANVDVSVGRARDVRKIAKKEEIMINMVRLDNPVPCSQLKKAKSDYLKLIMKN